ncbi:MAG: sigma 54-interacting transcriptional regulator [Spirochaetales bacterium]|nr:sigma 54-interacting transcriptional regulator [Spirochaetales bacterium]
MQRKSGLHINPGHALILAGIITGTFLFAHLLVLFFPALFGIWNHQINDHLFLLRYAVKGKESISPNIVHIALTNEGIRELDIPVWNRRIFGRIIDILNRVNVRAIVCDFMFQDPGTESDDEFLIDAAGESKNIYFPVIFQPEEYTTISKPGGFDYKNIDLLKKNLWSPEVNGTGNPPVSQDIIFPFYHLLEKATGIGHINLIPDSDGKNRRMPLIYKYKDTYMPALILRVISDFYQVQQENICIQFGHCIRLHDARISKKIKKDLFIPVDNKGTVPLNFTGPWQDSFFQFSVQSILNAEKDAELFSHLYDIMEDSIVLISDTSTRNKDYGPGIFHSVYPLSGLHLTLANMILKENYLHEPGVIENSIITLVLAFFLFFFSFRFKYRVFFTASLLIFFLYPVCEVLCFIFFNRLSSMVAFISGFLLAFTGISIYRLFTGELEKKFLQAEIISRKNLEQTKKRFFQDITHQMRTPLALIMSPLESLMTNIQKAEPLYLKHNLGLIKQNADKLVQTVNEILDIARMDAGKLKLQTEKTDIISLLDNLIYSFKGLARKKQIDIVFKKGFPELYVYIDPGRIEKVFSNLLFNAFKFTASGGKITVQLRSPVGPGNTSSKKSGKKESIPVSFTEIRVKDNGTGIPESELPFIFDRFHRATGVTENIQPGNIAGHSEETGFSTGVGLSVVKDYVEFHNGMVTVKSTPGKGTEFIVLLPNGKDHLDPLEIINKDIKTQNRKPGNRMKLEKTDTLPDSSRVTSEPAILSGDSLFPGNPVLIVDDETPLLAIYDRVLRENGITNILLCNDSTEVLKILNSRKVSAIALDLIMPGITGEKLLLLIKQKYPEIPVIISTRIQTIESAVQCIKAGAYDYMIKPLEMQKFISHIKHCVEKQDLKDEVVRLANSFTIKELKHPDAFSKIVTQDQQMLSLFKYIEAIAESPFPVLITGESGVGKELVARTIHKTSGRKGEFIAVNISEIDRTMFIDTLFGHKKGAYTGADSERKGLIEQAKNGTLFLDEIGDMDIAVQVKLLRFMEEQTYRPLGSDTEIHACVKIVAATNAELDKKLETGLLRKDFYYRFAQHKISVPPLRERPGDLPLLIKHFVEQEAMRLNKKPPAYTGKCISLLKAYSFPGNIRELKTMIIDVMRITDSTVLPFSYFKEYIQAHSPAEKITGTGKREKEKKIIYSGDFPTLKEIKDFFIKEALKKTGGIQSNAAMLLGISKYSLHRFLKKKTRN